MGPSTQSPVGRCRPGCVTNRRGCIGGWGSGTAPPASQAAQGEVRHPESRRMGGKPGLDEASTGDAALALPF